MLIKHRDELARLITIENGKSLAEAIGEVGRGIENVEFAAGAPLLIMGDLLATIATDVEATNYRYPIHKKGRVFNMPLIRFDLIEGRDEKSLRNLLDASHRAMVKVFGVPKRERYKIVHQHPTNELIIKDIGL